MTYILVQFWYLIKKVFLIKKIKQMIIIIITLKILTLF